MNEKLKLAVIGLDTSHAVEFPRLIQDPEYPRVKEFEDLLVTKCLRFETPFQGKDGLDKRQSILESIGVEVTEDFDYAVSDCDAIMIEINDPAYHLEYFEKCAVLGKPIFLDKPFADNVENMYKIIDTAKENNISFFTASSLRYDADLADAVAEDITPSTAIVWGPLGHAPAGSSIIWYGVHAFEMLERIMGRGAVSVFTTPDSKGCVCHVVYDDGRRGIADLSQPSGYGGSFRNAQGIEKHFRCSGRIPFYHMLMLEVSSFFHGNEASVKLNDSIEIMGMLAAAEESFRTGRSVTLSSVGVK